MEPSERTLPIVYRRANFAGFIHMSDERKEQNRPADTQIAKPYRRCIRDSSQQSFSPSSSINSGS